MTVVVLGGSGGVGEGVVRALLDDGATVIATGRDQIRLDEFAGRINNDALHVTPLEGMSDDLEEQVATLTVRFGPFDAVVVSIASRGSQGRKLLLALSDDEWTTLVEDNLTAVFRVYRAFLPSLKQNGLLLQLNGASADIPFPGNAVVALTAAASKSMTHTLAVELQNSGIQVYEIILGVVRTRARQLAGVDDRRWIDGEEIGIHIGELLARTSTLTGEVLQYFIDKAAGPVLSPPQF
ncbi:SDR family oxidoreductase [Subtercola boreus]|nr:SDR family NAD(P)-dependent oxidoreductase [Subtercola boreus]